MLDLLFSRFKFWRQFKGGIWWQVTVASFNDNSIVNWQNFEPVDGDKVYGYENYTKHCPVVILIEREFLNQIKNIARNGEWKDGNNLKKFVVFARTLHELGMDKRTIVDNLADLYWTIKSETTSGLLPRDFTCEELEGMLK